MTLPLLILCCSARAQYLVGVHAGVNELLQNQKVEHVSYEGKNFVGYVYPTLSAFVITDRNSRFNFGLTAQYLQRAFFYESYVYNPPHINHFITDHQSHYLYCGVMADVALDKKKYFHFALIPAAGFFLGGKETWYNGTYFEQGFKPFPEDSLHTDNKHIPKTDFRLGTQMRLQIPAGKRVSVSAAMQCNFGFASVNDLHRICPADLMFSFGACYALGKRYHKTNVPAPPAGVSGEH